MKLTSEQIHFCRKALISLYGSIIYRLTDADVEILVDEIKALIKTKLFEPDQIVYLDQGNLLKD